MTLYLQLDGVDDKLTLPSLTFNQIVIDGVFDSTQSTLRYIFQTIAGTNIYARLAADDSLQLLGVTQTGFVLDTRTTMTLTATTNPSTSTLNIFVRSDGGANFAKGKLYSIKFFNGATLVAHYDMSTGTVQDQSGNGRHATLTGGTWLDDGIGGDTVQTGTATILSNTTFNSSGIPIRLSNGTINGFSTFSSDAIPIRSADSTILGYGTLTADASIGSQILADAILNGSSLVDSNGIELRNGQSSSIGNSNISALGNYITQSNSSILGNSLVSVTVGSQSLASAIIQLTTNVTVNGLKQLIGNTIVNGISSTSFNGVRVILSDSGIDVNSNLDANTLKLLVADSQMNGNSGLVSDSIKLITAHSDINVHSSMSVFIGNRYVQVIPIAIDIKRNELIVTNIKRKSAIQIKI